MFLFRDYDETFVWFGFSHIMAILSFVFLFLLFYVYRHQISTRMDLVIRRSVAVIMVFMEWTFYAWALSQGGFQTSLLPFGVCAISMYVTAYALWTKNEKVFRFIFPWAIAGALISLVVADVTYTFPHFRYFHYFGNHGLFMLGNLYLLTVCQFGFTYKDLLKSSFILWIYALIMMPLNYLLDANHLFLREVPSEVAPMYAFLGDVWVIGFMFSILLLFHIIYLPMHIVHRKRILDEI